MRPKLTLDYFILSFIFILSRILFIFFTPYAFYDEEAKIGSIGYDIVFQGKLQLPFWGYLDSPHSGGSLFSGLIAAPFYLIFGDRYLVLKVAAIIFSVLTLFIWYRLISVEGNCQRRIFIPFLIFFTFATPHYVQKSVILSGNSVELMFFNALIIYYFWRIKNNPASGYRGYLFLGAICGFSFWVQFMHFYLFLAIIITILFFEKFAKRFSKLVFLFIGFLLGALPLWVYNFNYHWATLTTSGPPWVRISWDWHKLGRILFLDLPASFHFLNIGIIGSVYPSYILWGIIVLVSMFYLINEAKILIQAKRVAALGAGRQVGLGFFLIFYSLLFIILTSFSSFPVSGIGFSGFNSMDVHAEHYIVWLQPIFLVLLIVILNKYKSKITVFAQIAVSVIFIAGYWSLFSYFGYNDKFFYPMHTTEANAYECGFHFVKNPKLFLEFKQKIPAHFQENYLKGARDSQSES